MKKKIPTLLARLEQASKDLKKYQAGKMSFRSTLIAKDGTRTVWEGDFKIDLSKYNF